MQGQNQIHRNSIRINSKEWWKLLTYVLLVKTIQNLSKHFKMEWFTFHLFHPPSVPSILQRHQCPLGSPPRCGCICQGSSPCNCQLLHSLLKLHMLEEKLMQLKAPPFHAVLAPAGEAVHARPSSSFPYGSLIHRETVPEKPATPFPSAAAARGIVQLLPPLQQLHLLGNSLCKFQLLQSLQ